MFSNTNKELKDNIDDLNSTLDGIGAELNRKVEVVGKRIDVLEVTKRESSTQFNDLKLQIDNLSNNVEKIKNALDIKFTDEILRVKDMIEHQKVIVESSNDTERSKLESNVETRLIEFQKEIANRYFDSLDKILRTSREMTLINSLSGNNGKDVGMEAKLMQPILENRWKEKKEQDANKIESAGERIITKRNKLHEKILIDERHGLDVEKLKEEIKGYDWILEEITK